MNSLPSADLAVVIAQKPRRELVAAALERFLGSGSFPTASELTVSLMVPLLEFLEQPDADKIAAKCNEGNS